MIFCSFINGIHPSTHVFTHMFPPRGSYDRLCGAVATLLRPHWLGRVSGDPLPPGAGLSGVPRAPVSSTLCPATRKLSLQHRADHGLSCSQPFQGSSCPCDKARCPGARPPLRPVSGRSPSCHRWSPHGPWSAPREPGPPLRPVSGRSPSFHRCSPHGLRPQTQSSTPTLQGSVCLSPCLPFFLSLSLVLGTLLEPSLLSPLWRTRFSTLQLLLCPLHFFQGLQPQLDVKRAGPACPAQGCDPGTTTRPRVCGGSER